MQRRRGAEVQRCRGAEVQRCRGAKQIPAVGLGLPGQQEVLEGDTSWCGDGPPAVWGAGAGVGEVRWWWSWWCREVLCKSGGEVQVQEP